jgi:hypothetical protein
MHLHGTDLFLLVPDPITMPDQLKLDQQILDDDNPSAYKEWLNTIKIIDKFVFLQHGSYFIPLISKSS